MPKGKPKKLFPGMYKSGTAPSPTLSASPDPANKDQITQILSPGSEDDFVSSLPENTATSPAIEPAKRKRRTKAEIEAESNPDPLMADPRYKSAIGNMSGLGGGRLIKVGFRVTGKPLEPDEDNEIDDLFYVIGKRSNLDPGASWWVLGLYAFFLLCRLMVVRTEAGERLEKIFDVQKEDLKEEKQ